MTEILAPAGDLISLKAAIASGADAVYLGLSAFNARIKAENFTADNIAEITRYCHLFGVKVYVTVNISVKESEIPEVKKLISACSDAKVDAFIVSDLAVLDIAKKLAPSVRLHASTQFGICNAEGAKFAESVGFSRVVLSREATLEEIRRIREETSLEIEYFVHGALCVAFSGKCLMSSFINGGSGNRGRCLQPCRLQYTEKYTGKTGYLLSTSDLCLIDKLKELADAGVSSFKIEGRLRRPEYVYKTVSTYKKVIDSGFIVDENDVKILQSAYNRGNFTQGYSFDDTDKILSTTTQGNIGVSAGRITETFKDGFVKTDRISDFKKGQGYKLLDEKGKEVSGGIITEVRNGLIFVPDGKKGYEIRITSDNTYSFKEKKIPVDIRFGIDARGVLSAVFGTNNASVEISRKLDKATGRPLDYETVKSALTKTGDGVFIAKNVEGSLSGDFFAPRSTLNELRRKALSELEEEILKNYNFNEKRDYFDRSIIKKPLKYNNLVAVELQNKAQLSDYLLKNSDIIVYFPDDFTVKTVKDFLNACGSFSEKVFLKLPVNARENDVKIIENIIEQTKPEGLYADNPYVVYLAKKYNLKLFAGTGLNVYNEKCLSYFEPDYFLASPELTRSESEKLDSAFIFAYGYLPLMNLSHCVSKLVSGRGCEKCAYTSKGFAYSDRKGYEFRIYRNRIKNCYFTLYNSKIHDISSKVCDTSFNLYLNMLQCDGEKSAKILSDFKNGRVVGVEERTNGHFVKGVL